MLYKQFDANMKIGTGDEGVPVQGAQCRQVQGAQGTQVQGTQGTHAQGAQVKWQDDFGANRRLTVPQKRVLEQLAIWLGGQEKKTIPRIYWNLRKFLGMSQRAARVHVDALKKKGLIFSTVVYRSDSRQRIGVCISISTEAPIKHLSLPRKISETELQEMKESKRRNNQITALVYRGYTYVQELQGYVLPPPNLTGDQLISILQEGRKETDLTDVTDSAHSFRGPEEG